MHFFLFFKLFYFSCFYVIIMVSWCFVIEVVSMAYFLKKTKQQNRLYLAIYESFYSPEVNGTKHRCFKSLGNIESIKANGIADPISFYSDEVKKLNEQRKSDRSNRKFNQKLISDVSPERFLGYFPLANILNTLDVEEHFGYMQSTCHFHFDVYDIFSSLVFARAVSPSSKLKTFHDILPSLFKPVAFSYDQLLDALGFIGSEYEKFVEIFTVATKENFGIDTKHTYFDCTNFYFEIDRETDFQRKGPSKEGRHDPIVGLGLLLDSDMIPIGMKMYPGNESEKPVFRKTIQALKKQNNIDGRTIQVADKGLNCARNIIEAIDNCDGYIFSKSVKQLPKTERTWIFLEDGYAPVYDDAGEIHYSFKSCIEEYKYSYIDDSGKTIRKKVKEKRIVTFNPKLQKKQLREIGRLVEKAKKCKASQAKKDEYGDSAKYIEFKSADGKKVIASLNEKAIQKDMELAGYNLLVTSEIRMDDREVYNAYHELWRIEESFRIMKSELDARPVYVQKEDTIKGHFFICYVTVLLIRLFQFKVLKGRYSTSEICTFMKEFRIVKINENRYINMTRASDFITNLAIITGQPITNYYLTDRQIKMMHTR